MKYSIENRPGGANNCLYLGVAYGCTGMQSRLANHVDTEYGSGNAHLAKCEQTRGLGEGWGASVKAVSRDGGGGTSCSLSLCLLVAPTSLGMTVFRYSCKKATCVVNLIFV